MAEATEEQNPWPPCPRCGSNEFVHRGGHDIRLQYPPRQKYACTRCGKDKRFFAPNERRYRPGRLKQYQEKVIRQGPLASFGRWKIRGELARTLSCMYRESHFGLTPDQAGLNKFVSELIEAAVSDFRLFHPVEVFRANGRPVLKVEAPKMEPPKQQPKDPLREATSYV